MGVKSYSRGLDFYGLFPSQSEGSIARAERERGSQAVCLAAAFLTESPLGGGGGGRGAQPGSPVL